MSNFLKLIKSNRGDTVIEVMLSVTVLGLVATAAYVTSTRSFQAGLNAQYRGQAVAYAQQQVELIKALDANADTNKIKNNPGYPFCVNPDLTKNQITGSTQACSTPINQPDAPQDQYKVADKYDPAAKVFTITVSWTSADNKDQTTVMYYKTSGSWLGS